MKKMDQVDHTGFGTFGSCILKVLPLILTILHYNVQQLKCLTIRIQNQESFSFFGVGDYITDNPMCSPVGRGFRLVLLFEKNDTNALVFLVHYVKTPLS